MQNGSARSWVYVIGPPAPAPGPVKIGFTGDSVESRLTAIRAGDTKAPVTVDRQVLEILYQCEGDRQLETALHYHFRDLRVLGEWFALDPVVAPREVRMAISEHPRWCEAVRAQGRSELAVARRTRRGNGNVYARGREYAARAEDWQSPASLPVAAPDAGRGSPGQSPLTAAAIRHRELFNAWLAAGFTEDQALDLVVRLVAHECPTSSR